MRKEALINQRLNSNLMKDNHVHKFIEGLSNYGELVFFGGSIRDLYLEKPIINNPRDYDIVINNHGKTDDLEKYIEMFEYRKNRFGGYKININNTEFDIWRIDNTWAFHNKILDKKEYNLINSVYLSVDGIAYNYNKNILYDSVLKRTNDRKEISVVLDINPQKELNLLRALVYKNKYDYKLSYTLKLEYRLYKKRDRNFAKILYDLQFEHYKKELLSLDHIADELKWI